MKLQTYKVWRRIFQARMHDRRKQLFKLKCENLNYKRGLMLKHTPLDALKTLLKNRETRLLAMEAMFETVERKLLHLSLKEIRTHALIRIRLDGK